MLLLESVRLRASSFVVPWVMAFFGLRMLVLNFLSLLRGMSADEVVNESDPSLLLLG